MGRSRQWLGAASAALDAATPYAVAPWDPAVRTLCDDPGRRAPDDVETWLLGIRFAEASWS